jgi:hypothetical protein
LIEPDERSVRGDQRSVVKALESALRHGHILLFNGWYNSDEAGKIKKLYEEATQGIGGQRSGIGDHPEVRNDSDFLIIPPSIRPISAHFSVNA